MEAFRKTLDLIFFLVYVPQQMLKGYSFFFHLTFLPQTTGFCESFPMRSSLDVPSVGGPHSRIGLERFFGGLWWFWFKKVNPSRGYKPKPHFWECPKLLLPDVNLNQRPMVRKGREDDQGKGLGWRRFFLFSQGWLPICSGEAWCISFCCWVIWSDLKKRHSLDWCQDISAPEQSGSTCDIGGSTPIFLECRRGWSST